MKKLIVFGFLVGLLSSFTLINIEVSSVYICTGKYSKKYHYKKDCRGLSNCKSEIEEIDLQKAKELNRTLCGWED